MIINVAPFSFHSSRHSMSPMSGLLEFMTIYLFCRLTIFINFANFKQVTISLSHRKFCILPTQSHDNNHNIYYRFRHNCYRFVHPMKKYPFQNKVCM